MSARKPPTAQKTGRSAAAAKAVGPKPVDDATLAEIMRRFEAANPHPEGELEHTDPYTLLVAVVLSAQATDKGVNIATRKLFRDAADPAAMAALGEDAVTEHIRTIGLYRNKAKNVVALSRILVEQYGGIVPPSRVALESLPGVGRKTASVVMNIAFGEPTVAVDTHVFRISNRIPIVIGKTPDEIQIGLERRIPKQYLLHAHHWLILHGRYVCKARAPECGRCLIEDLCRYPAKTA
ncbi:endonuclease III [Enterovirga rhinocerotis]|uniref:Endonuclease III n=1 Tax=Enterovirga rhinocerotis TaxID=1339210 RepID=A0A4R7C6F9_9HYPH|nr:endonuclease III [Enterovirga rhinocerotis]TDR93831.1 DNA-(apurinic or apyrimidinic site) lyase /endonuclease III [Enterovirga rhinocerotis]